MDKIEQLYKTHKTIFRMNDFRVIWKETNPVSLRSAVRYYCDKHKLLRLHHGIYSLSDIYNPLELAHKLIVPSYISLETALQHYGVIYQAQTSISSFALYNKTLTIKGTQFIYHKIPSNILLNPLGITTENNVSIASPERAVADWIYLRGLTHFDNLSKINAQTLQEILAVYKNKSFEKRIKQLIKSL